MYRGYGSVVGGGCVGVCRDRCYGGGVVIVVMLGI